MTVSELRRLSLPYRSAVLKEEVAQARSLRRFGALVDALCDEPAEELQRCLAIVTRSTDPRDAEAAEILRAALGRQTYLPRKSEPSLN